MTVEMFTLIRLGRDVVRDGRLKALREQLNFSHNLMSELFHVTPITYARWERGNGESLRPLVAEKIGRFYNTATEAVVKLQDEGVDFKTLIPFHLVAAAAGVPQEYLLSKYRHQEIDAIDLGILGLWLHRADLKKLGVDDR
jgi:transcriptional regulator with XRE-family HTH domain